MSQELLGFYWGNKFIEILVGEIKAGMKGLSGGCGFPGAAPTPEFHGLWLFPRPPEHTRMHQICLQMG